MTAVASPFRVEPRPDGVAVVIYDVAGESTNTLRADFADHVLALVDRLEADPAVRGAVLVSGKEASFIVGADVGMLSAVTTRSDAEVLCRTGHRAIDRFAAMTKPVVAAVHGPALGGGFEVALACRARVASDDARTTFGLPEMQLGLLPGLHGLQRLAGLVGFQVALDHGLTGKNLRAKKALALGVVADVVPRSILVDVAARVALTLAEGDGQPRRARRTKRATLTDLALETNPIGHKVLFAQARKQLLAKTRGNYPAAERIVDVIETFARRGWEASCEAEAVAFADLLVSTTSRRLVEIFFATTALKKDPGVDDPAVTPLPVEKIGVVGAGLMGAGIAYVSADAGIEVRLRDKDEAGIAGGMKVIASLLDQRVKRGSLTRLDRDRKVGLVTGTVDGSGMSNAALVVEAVFEDLALKHGVLADVEASGSPDVIFASNTSSLPIARIAAAAKRPARVVGMHYFSPVHKMPLLEVIRTDRTAPEVIATAVAVGKRQGKTVIVVKDGVGFYTSRVLAPYMNEASWILSEGASVEQIDEAMLDWGFPVGPIALLDEVGIDVAAHVGPILREAFGDRIAAPPAAARLVDDDRKGRKNGRGFYLYGASKAGPLGLLGRLRGKRGKGVDDSVYGVLGLPVPDRAARPKVATEEIQMRCALQFVNEALHCLGEGIVRSPRDGDVGAIFGLGFPPFRGGPFRYVDAVGPDEVLRRVRQYEARFGARWTPAPLLVELAATHRHLYPR